MYLVFKYYSHVGCSAACDCPAVEPPDSAIDRTNGDIYYKSDRVIEPFMPWHPADTAKGLIIYGWFEEELFAIGSLPMDVPRSGLMLLGCDADGKAVVEIGGEAKYLEAKKGWSHQSVADEGGGCYMTYTMSLSNVGLMEKERFISDLSWQDDHIQLVVRSEYNTMEEGIAIDIIVTGEDNIDFSAFCSVRLENQQEGNWVDIGACDGIPDYVPEPFPRLPGAFIEMTMPSSAVGEDYAYHYELVPGVYRIKLVYTVANEVHEFYSREFRVIE
jgi:hypothetical protein